MNRDKYMVSDLLPIQSVNNVDVVDSRLIAIELGIQHKNFYQAIKDNQTDIEQALGHLLFETDTVKNSVGAVNEVKFAYLNEDQATYLMTLSRNTPQVKKLKLKLVKSFSHAKKLITATQFKTPQTYLEALKALVATEEEKQILLLENQQLQKENLQLAEAVDDLFSYSSILRIAKFNNVHESKFSYHRLKAVSIQLGIEPKRVPCPRYEYKLLYHHDAWRYAYPDYRLPETTTLRLVA